MPYVKVSIPKNGDGAGCADPKSSEIIIIDVADVATEPTRELGNVALTGDVELKEGGRSALHLCHLAHHRVYRRDQRRRRLPAASCRVLPLSTPATRPT